MSTHTEQQPLPDTQNQGSERILGANVPIQQVGISNFRLPLQYRTAEGDLRTLETSVTGTVGLQAGHKGINMSRIIRTFYEFEQEVFTPGTLEPILRAYCERINSPTARLKLRFSYPIRRPSLRSGASGWQYYRCCFEGSLDAQGRFRSRIHFEFVYSSACPASHELSLHALEERGVMAIPHSQRSNARISVEIDPRSGLTIEDLQQLAERALLTETQVMVRRADEQAFAELNGEQTKFVEDAARLLYAQLAAEPRIQDFQAAIAHLESLHSHDAVAVIVKGVPGGFEGEFDDFRTLIV
ncbi:MAG: GTP cyclohydrolase FolE2 [Verrucomicrobiota bacterium JB022]|nr:GTP cyclohydrolase FolE2 [Verrucomicrobiota bacterium JB022]